VLQQAVAAYGLDTDHFGHRSPWRKYPDEAIAEAAASSSSIREVVTKLGGTPATGTLSHIRRRIDAAGIDISHFPGLNTTHHDLPFTSSELEVAAGVSDSVRATARALGIPDDGRSRSALIRTLREHGIDTAHFRNARMSIPESALRAAVPGATSYADVMRALSLPISDTNHRRLRRMTARLGLDTSHFKRRPWGTVRVAKPRASATQVLGVRPAGSPRTNRARLHRALQELGVPYCCASCRNPGEWLGKPITLQIDHVDGNWLDNRPENLRYLCPNCHALTETWCRKRPAVPGQDQR
jgi:hypothetical protein